MKEAAGEANMTVITIVLIGIVLAAAIPIIQGVMRNSRNSSCCQSNGGIWANGACKNSAGATVSTVCPAS